MGCTSTKIDDHDYTHEYFENLSLTKLKYLHNMDFRYDLKTLSEETWEDFRSKYILNIEKFINCHNDIWTNCPKEVFNDDYKFVSWAIIMLVDSNVSNKLSTFSFINKSPDFEVTIKKKYLEDFVDKYVYFISEYIINIIHKCISIQIGLFPIKTEENERGNENDVKVNGNEGGNGDGEEGGNGESVDSKENKSKEHENDSKEKVTVKDNGKVVDKIVDKEDNTIERVVKLIGSEDKSTHLNRVKPSSYYCKEIRKLYIDEFFIHWSDKDEIDINVFLSKIDKCERIRDRLEEIYKVELEFYYKDATTH